MVGRGSGGRRGKDRGGPFSSKAGAPGVSSVASANDSHFDTRQSNGFTRSPISLSEEARNTERRYAWNSDLKLRHSHVAFISAGTSTAEELNPVLQKLQKSEASGEATETIFQGRSEAPAKATENPPTAYTLTPDAQMSNLSLNELRPVSTPQVNSEKELALMSKRSNIERSLKDVELSSEIAFLELEDADRSDRSVHTGPVAPLVRRSSSPTGSDSSGEVVIFAGRRQSCNEGDQKHISHAWLRGLDAQNVSKSSALPISSAIVMDNPIDAKLQIQVSPKQRPPRISLPNPERAPSHISSHSRATAMKSGRRRRRRHARKETKDEGFFEDYAANVRDGYGLEALLESSTLNQRELGGADTADRQDEAEALPTGLAERDPLTNSEERDSADLEDFDELSTSNEALENIDQIFSKRKRPSGVQYLVIGAGCTIDDARWFPTSLLNSQGAEPLIQKFEENPVLDHFLNSSNVSDANLTVDEQVAQDLHENLGDKEGEKDHEERMQARLTDEQVARLLAKQEERELGSDDLMLFDGSDVGTDSQQEFQLDWLRERAVTYRAPSMSKKRNQPRSKFPSATAFAQVRDQDPYNGFDVMDQQRPSLRRRVRSRRGKCSMELSDSELEQSIHTAWEKDRTKKKKRKQAREELRAQGILGTQKKPDLKAKYSDGISMVEVKNEIRDFLLSSMESLPLPPMARTERKKVHEIANVFKLKSKSTGGGKSRFPVLYKTSRTIPCNEETLKATESVLSSGHFLPRMDRAKRKDALVGRGHRGGAASAGVSYRDGEVVGAAAPEIGQENRGRTMLERMGWSTGTALGALNNSRGLVQPVAQVVKTSRSGLG